MAEENKKIKAKKVVKPTVKKVASKKTPTKKVLAKKTNVKKVDTKTKKVVAEKTPVKKVVSKKTATKLKTITKKITKTAKTVHKKVSFISKCVHNLNFIKRVFLDVFLLFKNFIHWNVSKIIIFVWSIILWFAFIVPLLIIFFIYTFFWDVNIWMLIAWLFSWKLLPDFLGNIILMLTVITYIITFSYSNILLTRVNNWYKDDKKLDFKKNEYYNIKKVVKYFNITLLNILILLIPVLIFVVLMWGLFLVWGSLNEINILVNSWAMNYFTIISFIFLIWSFIFLSYLFYRVIFSYFLLSDDSFYKKEKNALSYIKESFNKTRKIKKFFKFIVIIIIFIVLTAPINYIGKVFENNGNILNDYTTYLSLTDSQKEYISSEDLYYYETLKIEFNWLSLKEINRKIEQNYISSILYIIFSFLVLNWLFVMVFSSFYRRELK